MLTGLPRDYAIQRQRIRDSKHYLITVDSQDGNRHAGIVFTEFASVLKEFELDIRAEAIPLSKRCFAGVRRGTTKTYVTLYDPSEPGVPHSSTPTGTAQSDENWRMFKEAIIANGHRLFIADAKFLKTYTTIWNAVEVISIQD